VRIPLLMAANRRLARLTIADVVVQLRCRQCGQRPTGVASLEDGESGWRVMLVGGDEG
jgi:hypothetical protein